MLKKEFVLVGGLLLLILTLAALPVQAAGNPVVEKVHGNTRMTVPLSVFNPELEGEAEMRRLHYNMRKRADGSVTGRYDYDLSVRGNVTTASGDVICFKVEDNRAWIGTKHGCLQP